VLRELVAQADRLPALPDPVGGVGTGAADDDAERAALSGWLEAGCGRLQREGRLPLAGLGPRWQRQFAAESLPMALALRQVWRGAPQRAEPQRLSFRHRPAGAPVDLQIDDWLDGLRRLPDGGLLWTDLVASRLCRPQTEKESLAGKKLALRPDKLQRAWLVMLLAGALGLPLRGVLVGRDACAELSPPSTSDTDIDTARHALQRLLGAWWRSQRAPLPVAPRAAMAALQLLLDDKGFGFPTDGSVSSAWPAEALDAAAQVYDGSGWSGGWGPEREAPALARIHPDAESLLADGDAFRAAAEDLYLPLAQWAAAQTARLHPRSLVGDGTAGEVEDDAT
jgi:exodeoxyribonuclease V gamma subunit